MNSLPDRTIACKQHGKSAFCPYTQVHAGIEGFLVISILMPHQLGARKSLVEERLKDKVGRTQKIVGELIFLFLSTKNIDPVRILIVRRQEYTQSFRFSLNRFICISGMSVRPFQYSGNS